MYPTRQEALVRVTAAALFLTGLLLSPLGINAQHDQVSLEALLAPPFPSEMAGAPDADRLAWVSNRQGVRNILCAEAPGWEPMPVTRYQHDDGQEIGSLAWSPNGARIAFVRGGAPNRAGEIPNPTLDPRGARQTIFVAEASCRRAPRPQGATTAPQRVADGTSPQFRDDQTLVYLAQGKVHEATVPLAEARPRPKRNPDEKRALTKPIVQARGGVGSLTLSPDRTQLALVSTRGTHSFLGLYDFETKKLRYLDPSVDRDLSPTFSPDGSQVAFLRLPTSSEPPQIFTPQREGWPWSIRVVDVDTGRGREVWRAQQGMGSVFRGIVGSSQLAWTEDDYLIFPWEGDGWTHLYSVRAQRDAASASPADLARPLTPGDGEVEYMELLPDRTAVVFSSNHKDIDRRHLWQVDSAGRLEQLTHGNGVENVPVPLRSGSVGYVAARGRTPLQPFVLLTESANNGSGPGANTLRVRWRPFQVLAQESVLSTYPSNELVEPQQVVFPSTDGMPIHGQLFVPRKSSSAAPDAKHPALLFLHGGSRRHMMLGFHYSSYYHNTYTFNQYMASRGWVVLSVNYRSGIGYGRDFREALDYGAAGASELRDVQGAALFLRTREDVDPDRIALYGGSYGGYLTALGLARSSDLFFTGVDIHGVHDWNRTIQNFVPDYDPLERPEAARLAFESSPLAHVEDWRSPVLLIHGDDDRNVPFAETTELVEKLREHEVPHEIVVYPDEVHGFLRYATWLDLFERSAEFLERMAKGE